MNFHFGLYVIGLPQVLQGLVRNSGSMGSGLETGLVPASVPFEKIFEASGITMGNKRSACHIFTKHNWMGKGVIHRIRRSCGACG